MVSHPVTRLPALCSQHPKILYRVQNSPPLLPILSQTEPVQALPPFFFKIQFKFYPPIHACVFQVFSSPSVCPFSLFTFPDNLPLRDSITPDSVWPAVAIRKLLQSLVTSFRFGLSSCTQTQYLIAKLNYK